MILPWLKGFLTWEKVPLTWTLIVLNLIFFVATSEPHKSSVTKDFANSEMMIFSGKLFYQFQNQTEKTIPYKTESEWMVLGSQALRNAKFINSAASFQFFGDEIAIKNWKQKVHEYQSKMKDRSTYIFGLRGNNTSPLTWVTYQFTHASWFHLISNMLMFAIFGAALETTIGGLGLIIVYLLSGIAGAWAFQLLSLGTLAPVVGASGALSGVMAFYAAFEKKRRISYFYFICPLPGYFGWIYLPTLLIIPMQFLPDLVGYLSTPSEIGAGIAYTAHIGGALLGGLLGWSLRYFRKSLWFRWLTHF